MDTELLKRAKHYIDDMSKGINPISKAKVSKDDLINNKIFIFFTSKKLILNYLYLSITSFARGISAGAKS